MVLKMDELVQPAPGSAPFSEPYIAGHAKDVAGGLLGDLEAHLEKNGRDGYASGESDAGDAGTSGLEYPHKPPHTSTDLAQGAAAGGAGGDPLAALLGGLGGGGGGGGDGMGGLMEMASQMMQNPSMQQMMGQMMGGAGAGGTAGPAGADLSAMLGGLMGGGGAGGGGGMGGLMEMAGKMMQDPSMQQMMGQMMGGGAGGTAGLGGAGLPGRAAPPRAQPKPLPAVLKENLADQADIHRWMTVVLNDVKSGEQEKSPQLQMGRRREFSAAYGFAMQQRRAGAGHPLGGIVGASSRK